MELSPPAEQIKAIPPEAAARQRIREAARAFVAAQPRQIAPERETLEAWGKALLDTFGFPYAWLGFTMVALDNAFWEEAFAAVPYAQRLLLLPKCLQAQGRCAAPIDAEGLHCQHCGACGLGPLKEEAEEIGYRVLIAEGTTAVVTHVLQGTADAILGVACLDSLEKSFERIAAMGIPHQAIPLLRDGCVDTEAEWDEIRALLYKRAAGEPEGKAEATVPGSRRTYLPLLRFTQEIFEQELEEIVQSCACAEGLIEGEAASDPALGTDAIAREWLLAGGKRLRPFITIAAYVTATRGEAALAPEAPLSEWTPPSVRALAVAIEALHKAALVHDDIEDDDAYRYGRPTVHQQHGLPVAINVGDYLVGLGYRLIAAQAPILGAEAVTDILSRLTRAHLQLCCGQSAELMWKMRASQPLQPLDVLQIARLKTAPAFEAALYTGLRAAGPVFPEMTLRAFAQYVGEAYQVLDDLQDWEEEGEKQHESDTDRRIGAAGRDFLAGRPTILYAFAVQAGAGEALSALLSPQQAASERIVQQVRQIYEKVGAFARAERLYERLRQKAWETTEQIETEALRAFFRFLVRLVLPDRTTNI